MAFIKFQIKLIFKDDIRMNVQKFLSDTNKIKFQPTEIYHKKFD